MNIQSLKEEYPVFKRRISSLKKMNNQSLKMNIQSLQDECTAMSSVSICIRDDPDRSVI